ncbi:MAG: hypothetical protein ABFC67_14525 [Mizugakiibacter sp.]|uniref:hypothetical protein n=1 Tax=Mizugakiibacter sp. TaxID=1972610 RepID=UPI0032109CCA
MSEAAATEKKDLSYYLNHPDELGDLPNEQIDALATQGESSGEPDAATENKGDTESAATPGDTAGTEKKDEQSAKPDDQTPEGILARDGKHIIPYSRLEAAEAKARDLSKQIEGLQAKIDGKQEAESKTGTEQEDGLLSDTELEELEHDLPALAKVIRAQQSQIRQLNGRVESLNESHKSHEEVQARDAQTAWNEALSKNPKAAYLDQTLSPEVGQKFVNAAASLHDNWSEMSDDDRAAAIVRQYEAVNGEIKVKQVATQQDKPTAKEPEKKPDVPLSMSAIPGGSAPPVDEAAALAQKSGVELLAMFEKMTPDQIEAQLNRI